MACVSRQTTIAEIIGNVMGQVSKEVTESANQAQQSMESTIVIFNHGSAKSATSISV